MFAAFSLATSAMNCGQVVGVEVIPACLKSALLYQKPTTPTLYGTPYCWPFTCQPAADAADGLDPRRDVLGDVATLPAFTWSTSAPPPHSWKTSGGLLDCERDRDLRLLQLLVLDRDGLDRDVRMRGCGTPSRRLPELGPLRPGWRCATSQRGASASLRAWLLRLRRREPARRRSTPQRRPRDAAASSVHVVDSSLPQAACLRPSVRVAGAHRGASLTELRNRSSTVIDNDFEMV